MFSIADIVPQLERRTVQLLKTLEQRQSETRDGFLELSKVMYHWAHDFMVRVISLHLRPQNVDKLLHILGRYGLRRLQ